MTTDETNAPQVDAKAVGTVRARLGAAFGDRRYRLVVWAFVVGSVGHLLLPRVWQMSWLGADVAYLLGIVLLIAGIDFAGWCLAAVGLAVPLLFLRDPLTQSAILLFVSVAGALATGLRGAPDPEREPTAGDGPPSGASGFLCALRGVTIAVYGLAAFHKLNADFFDPTYSCGVHGLRQVVGYWNLGGGGLPGGLAAAVPFAVVAAEAGIAVLHAVGCRRIGWTTAVAFHIALTFTMAPAFVFVMLVGHAAFATSEDIDRLREVVRRHAFPVGAGAAVLTAGSIWMHGSWPSGTFVVREWAIWALLVGLVVASPPWRAAAWERRSGGAGDGRVDRWTPVAVVGLFVVNGLTPYLGVQYQHTAAMVSNLRIDRGCWNHLIVPEAVRLEDPYIRVEEVYFGRPGRDPRYEKIVRRHLWSPPQFRQMRRNWCGPDERPFYLRGTYRGESFEIEDLCRGESLPFGAWRIAGEALLGDFLRFQKNLKRDCPQRCIH